MYLCKLILYKLFPHLFVIFKKRIVYQWLCFILMLDADYKYSPTGWEYTGHVDISVTGNNNNL